MLLLLAAAGVLVPASLCTLMYFVPALRDGFFGKIVWPKLVHMADKSLAPTKRDLFEEARLHGRVLEMGAGEGVNLSYYKQCPEIKEVVMVEPNKHLFPLLQAACKASDAPAATPFFGTLHDYCAANPDAKFDHVVSTLVLCSVNDVGATLREVQQLLKPGGSFVFLEHVAAEGGARLAVQKMMTPVFCSALGCHPDRTTAATIMQSGFARVHVQNFINLGTPWPMRPHIRGIASV